MVTAGERRLYGHGMQPDKKLPEQVAGLPPSPFLTAAPPPYPTHPGLTARLTQWCATDQLVAGAVVALNSAHATPLAVGIADPPVGSDYLAASNMIVLSAKYAGPGFEALADKLILYRLACGLYQLDVDVRDPVALQAFNTRQEHLWRLANPRPGPAPDQVRRFYQGTNRENFYRDAESISVAGLKPSLAGSGIGCKRWERHDIAAEHKDQGWHTVTLSFEVALSYARQHTEWAMGMKRNELTLRDVADFGGLVLCFDVPVADLADPARWRPDRSGDPNNFQTTDVIAANRLQVVEALAIPDPLTKVAPPPMAAVVPPVVRAANPGTETGSRRRVYPPTPM